ncbi:hypothetical protein AB0K15_24005 [Amycolatopsis sp. NPDC049253]|uniref:hypothetical protein n=1 Tax=Amycolatopsis sp. NPDC049253 TaxID=3155274 RepID=UPI003435C5ED
MPDTMVSDRAACASRRCASPTPFAREADMLLPLVEGYKRYAGPGDLVALYEVQTTRGVVDLVFVEFDFDVTSSRLLYEIDSITDFSLAQVVHVLSSTSKNNPEGLTTGELAAAVGLSRDHIRRAVLRSESARHWVAEVCGRWVMAREYRSPIKKIVAVEAKRSDWRRAISQAASHVEFADITYVAMDASRLPKNENWRGPLIHAGLGLVAVSALEAVDDRRSLSVRKVLKPRRSRPKGPSRLVVAERIVDLVQNGSKSGPVAPVFGEVLTSSWGDDPRLTPDFQ